MKKSYLYSVSHKTAVINHQFFFSISIKGQRPWWGFKHICCCPSRTQCGPPVKKFPTPDLNTHTRVCRLLWQQLLLAPWSHSINKKTPFWSFFIFGKQQTPNWGFGGNWEVHSDVSVPMVMSQSDRTLQNYDMRFVFVYFLKTKQVNNVFSYSLTCWRHTVYCALLHFYTIFVALMAKYAIVRTATGRDFFFPKKAFSAFTFSYTFINIKRMDYV